MDRRIALAIPELGLSASVRMLVDRAPLTCAAIWEALETPVERRLIHTATTGPVVFFYNFPALRDAKDLPIENHTSIRRPAISSILPTVERTALSRRV